MSRRRIGFWYRLAAVIAKPPLIALLKRDWRGMENIPAEGGFITAVNHNSYLDPFAYAHFQYNTGRVPRFLAKASLFTPFFVGSVMRGTGQIPVFRATVDAAAAFRAAVEAVEKGECVVFYPEGTLTRDPDLWPMVSKTGVARVALLTKAPVIPVAQWGANELLAPYTKKPSFLPRKTHRVLAGPPVDLSAYYGKEHTPEVLREVTDLIMEEVKQLLAELRGEPAPAGLFDPRKAKARKKTEAKEAKEEARQEAEGGTRAAAAVKAAPSAALAASDAASDTAVPGASQDSPNGAPQGGAQDGAGEEKGA